jgi:hypothetical protein
MRYGKRHLVTLANFVDTKGKLLSRRTRLRILADGWPKQPCHCSLETQTELRHTLPDDDTSDRIGYILFLHGPCRTMHLVRQSFMRKNGVKLKKHIIVKSETVNGYKTMSGMWNNIIKDNVLRRGSTMD